MVNRGKSNGTPIRLLWVINCTGYPNNTERKKKKPLHSYRHKKYQQFGTRILNGYSSYKSRKKTLEVLC